ERLWTLRGAVSSTGSLTAELVPLLARGDLAGAAEGVGRRRLCPARRVFGDVLGAAPEAPLEELERVADERQFEEVEGCGAYLWVLGTIGSSAPFIGLFGTVVGIMRAFHSMAIVGTGRFGVVAGGISEALIATALGLAIGIISLVFYNYLQNRVERIDAALRIGRAQPRQGGRAGRRPAGGAGRGGARARARQGGGRHRRRPGLRVTARAVVALAAALAAAAPARAQEGGERATLAQLEQRSRAFYALLEHGERERAAATWSGLEADLARFQGGLQGRLDRMRDEVIERDGDLEELFRSPRFREPEVMSLVAAYHLAWVRYHGAQLTGDPAKKRALLQKAVEGFSQFLLVNEVPEIYADSLYGRGLAFLELGDTAKAIE